MLSAPGEVACTVFPPTLSSIRGCFLTFPGVSWWLLFRSGLYLHPPTITTSNLGKFCRIFYTTHVLKWFLGTSEEGHCSVRLKSCRGWHTCSLVSPLPFSFFISPFLPWCVCPWLRAAGRECHWVCCIIWCAVGISVIRSVQPACGPEKQCFVGKCACGVWVWGESGRNGWGRSEWRGTGMGSLKAGMLSRVRCLLVRGGLLKCLAIPSSSCYPLLVNKCLGMRPSCMLASDHHNSGIQVWVDVHVWGSGLSWDRAK